MSRLTASQELIQHHLPRASSGQVAPRLPGWLLRLPGVNRIVARIGETEFRRRLFHMSPALLPIGLSVIPHRDVWGPTLVSIMIVVCGMALFVASRWSHCLTRKGEKDWMRGAVLGYLVPVVAPLVLFPGRAEWGLMTLQIIALGDGSATFGGLMLGGQRLPWNRRKTVTGLICFTLVGSLAATYAFWGEANPFVSLGKAFAICGTAALAAGLVESLPIRTNDNFRVGMTALLVGMGMTALLA